MSDALVRRARRHDEVPQADRVTAAEDRCWWCRKVITDATKAGMGLYSIDVFDDGMCGHPSSTAMYGTVAILEHAECAPEVGYYVRLHQLAQRGLGDWRLHLRAKPWWNPIGELDDALKAAHTLASRLLNPPAPPPKPVARPAAKTVTRKPTPPARLISLRTRTQVMERDGFRCRRCGATPRDERLVVDHVVPVSKGGTADPDNLQTLCDPCNAGKADREPHPHDMAT